MCSGEANWPQASQGSSVVDGMGIFGSVEQGLDERQIDAWLEVRPRNAEAGDGVCAFIRRGDFRLC
jgi:hypothetical protein